MRQRCVTSSLGTCFLSETSFTEPYHGWIHSRRVDADTCRRSINDWWGEMVVGWGGGRNGGRHSLLINRRSTPFPAISYIYIWRLTRCSTRRFEWNGISCKRIWNGWFMQTLLTLGTARAKLTFAALRFDTWSISAKGALPPTCRRESTRK